MPVTRQQAADAYDTAQPQETAEEQEARIRGDVEGRFFTEGGKHKGAVNRRIKRGKRREKRKAKKKKQNAEIQRQTDRAEEQTQGSLERANQFADSYQAQQAQGDPEALAAQRRALQQLGQWSTGQVTDADRAAQQQSQMQAEQMAQGQREAATQAAAARGMGRSGASLQAGLMAGQNAANAGYNAASNTQNMAQQRALAAIGQTADLGTTMRGQTMGQQQSLDQFNQANQQFATQTGQQTAQQGLDQATYQRNIYDKKKNAILGAVGGLAGGGGQAMGGM